MSELKEFFKGKDIIVTGGIGSIGSEVVVQLLKYEPRQVRIFDNRETEIFHMQHLLKNHKNVRYLVGDVREKDRLRKAFAGCDIVFHAAALKHVPSCEYNPFEAVKTNILGTQNVIEAAIEEGVRKVIFISTDKAVNPINTMGASKLLAEKLMLNANISGNKDTIFSCVRFGNVLNSNGSVIPLFKNQIENGGPVTLTHGDMRRFFISIPQAIDLVLRAAHKAKGREIFVLKMQGCKVKDLAEVIINEYAPTIGKKPEDIKIETVGLRAGEKIDELLISEEELEITSEDEDLFVIKPGIVVPHYEEKGKGQLKKVSVGFCNSKHAELLSKEQLKTLLKKEKIL